MKPDDLKIGDRDITKMIDVCEKNNKKFLNVRKFENQCKSHDVEEKSRMVIIWCRKIMGLWEDTIERMKEQKAKQPETAEEKKEVCTFIQCKRDIRPLYKGLKKCKLNKDILDALYLIV